MTKIKILDVKKFVTPLKSLSLSVNSIVLTKKGDTLAVNAKSEDASQVANILYTSKIVEYAEGGDTEKMGIYNLGEFISVLQLFSDVNALELVIEGNTCTIQFNDKSKIDYILSDLSLITEGPEKLKSEIPWFATIEVDSSFIKKVKSISSSIDVNILKLKSAKGKLSYNISSKQSQSHNYSEVIADCDKDFDVSVSIKDDKRDNFGYLYDGVKYKISIHTKVIQLEAVGTEYGMLRYYIAPLV